VPRAPGLITSRKSRCRSRLPELAHEVIQGLNHDDGSFRINLGDMTQTLETQLAANKRLKIYKSSPELLDAMMALSAAAAKDLDPELGELIKIRASQINHCAFCLNMHLVDARKHGVSEQKLDVLAAWEEAGDLFSERERAVLALTEAITEVADGVPDDVYQCAAETFDDRELGQIIAAVVAINAWNRINVTVRTAVPRR
jgi:AhpD family alkylhydroperoxidase